MSGALRAAYAAVERDTKDLVDAALVANGVPASPAEAYALAETMVDWINEQRQMQWALQADTIRHTTPGMKVAPPREYKTEYLVKQIMRSAGLTPEGDMTVPVEMFDAATQATVTRRVAPFAAPDAEDMRVAMTQRLSAGVARHVKQAGRDAVVDSARLNRTRWARQMMGAETCAFCAMLVSRGAVYAERTAHFRTHDYCDCTAVLVPNPSRWEGKEQADEFYELWKDAYNAADGAPLKEFRKRYRQMNGA